MSSLVLRLTTFLAAIFLSSLSLGSDGPGVTANPGFSAAVEHAPCSVGQGILASPEGWVSCMLGAIGNRLGFKHSEDVVHWLDALNEPRFMTALASVALDHARDPFPAGRGIEPSAVRHWSEFADPDLYLRSMLAGMDGRFHRAIISCMANPGTLHHRVNHFTVCELRVPVPMVSDKGTGARQGAALVKAGNNSPAVRLNDNPSTAPDRASAFIGGAAMAVVPEDWLRLPGSFMSEQGKSPRPLSRY